MSLTAAAAAAAAAAAVDVALRGLARDSDSAAQHNRVHNTDFTATKSTDFTMPTSQSPYSAND